MLKHLYEKLTKMLEIWICRRLQPGSLIGIKLWVSLGGDPVRLPG